MRLNDIRPAKGARKASKRLGRGHAAGQGKTCGRGVKGQHARSGGYHKVGFEGGQMPLQRRLPKIGFASRKARFAEQVRLHELARVEGDTIDLLSLKEAGVVSQIAKQVKLIASGTIDRAVTVKGIGVTPGAKAAIEAAGGRVED